MNIKDNLLNHCLLMISRNRKAYGRLALSIILSFTAIFSVFFYFDIFPFHQEKEIFKQPSYLARVQIPEHLALNSKEVQQYLKEVSSLKNTNIIPITSFYPEQKYMNSIPVEYHFVPKSFGVLYDTESLKEMVSQKGSQSFSGPNFAIIEDGSYRMLKASGDLENDEISLYLPNNEGNWGFQKLKIQDTLLSGNRQSGNLRVFLPNEFYDSSKGSGREEHTFFILSPFAKDVTDLAYKYNFTANSPSLKLPEARQNMRNAILLKILLGSLIFLLLTWNLKGSFDNALKERRYEIGLRRALGATSTDIIKQFMLEASLIIGVGAILSFAIVVFLFSILRAFIFLSFKQTLILSITPASGLTLFLMVLTVIIYISISFALSAMDTRIVSVLQGGE